MSSSSRSRIKEIRQKASASEYTPIPLGADAQYIDMSSSLDLEEELKLGGNHRVEIEENEESVQVVEYYIDHDSDHTPSTVYKVTTSIQLSGPIKLLVGQLIDQFENSQDLFLGVDDKTTISVGVSGQKITSKLFKGYSQIHTKTINFSQIVGQQSRKDTIIQEVNI